VGRNLKSAEQDAGWIGVFPGRSNSTDAESGILPKASSLEQTTELAVVTIVSVWSSVMSETSVYTIERNAWSTVRQCNMHFLLTYEREFLPLQNLWRDFLVNSQETGLANAAYLALRH
jgi:hypothetical protein